MCSKSKVLCLFEKLVVVFDLGSYNFLILHVYNPIEWCECLAF